MILAFLFNNFSNTIGTVQDIINVADIIFPEEHERTDRDQLKDLINKYNPNSTGNPKFDNQFKIMHEWRRQNVRETPTIGDKEEIDLTKGLKKKVILIEK